MIVHCLFEQSGTFRDAFRKFGYEAYDYDIDNQFGKTDYQIDLFDEIQRGYNGELSIFDNISQDDLIMAFFPCIRFTNAIQLMFRCDSVETKKWDDVRKLEYSRKLASEQALFYDLFCKLFIIVERMGLQMIVENPYNDGYLKKYFPIRPTIIDLNRTLLGDKFIKPTQYWFVGITAKQNRIKIENDFRFGYRDRVGVESCLVRSVHGINRSLIEPKYAENFIKKYILESEVMPNDKKVTNS